MAGHRAGLMVEGPVAAEGPQRVFINCPFDKAYEPLFDALLFVAVAYNFVPTTAMSSGDEGTPRIERLRSQLREVPYSLHDLSRCTGEGEFNTARMNMPFELGMAMMRQHLGSSFEGVPSHQWAALVPGDRLANRFISDLAGFDLLEYGGDADIKGLVAGAASFLATKSEVPLTPRQILAGYDDFRADTVRLRAEWEPGSPRLDLFVNVATRHARALLD